MKNFADIMKKAQQMQQKMTDMQKELESAEVTGAAGAGMVQVVMTGDGKARKVSIDPSVAQDTEVLEDLLWLRDYRFEKVSERLGPTRMSVTVIQAGTQHNVVPDACHFVVDVRTNECYTNEEVFRIIDAHTKSEMKARSFRLSSSSVPMGHPLVERCLQLGLKPYGSPTLSDQALMPFPSLKMGPGDSARSHAADEYICVSEIEGAIDLYLRLLS